MKTVKKHAGLTAIAAGLALWAASADAASITCPTAGTFDRQATMTNVEACKYVGPITGTPDASSVATQFGGSWTNEGGVTGNASNDLLTVGLNSGAWGALPVAGTLNLDDAFWSMYGRAVITIHLGNGSGDPDWFFFELTHGATAADFSVVKISGGGGGLSNINLWGSGTPFEQCDEPCTPVVTPEPGSLLLLGTGLMVFAARLRRRTRA